jgi:hypothetical protein
MSAQRYRLLDLLLSAALLACSAGAAADQPVSAAEDRLFLSDHLGNLPPNSVLRYAYSKAGSLEAPREGTVRMTVTPSTAGPGRQASVEFLTGTEKLDLPVIDAATANPVILFFLERDVREMQRRTSGQASYFRKRLRMALADAAEIRPVTFKFAGQSVSGQEITVRPYRDDPLKTRFEQMAGKIYTFMFSDQVPGMLYQMRTVVDAPSGADGAAPVLEETLTLLGTEP